MQKIEDLIIPPLAIVCHDAGGANPIIAWLKNYKDEVKICMEGPAKKIWEKNFPEIKTFSLKEVLKNSKTLISGTGASKLEFIARIEARKKCIKNIAILDHWSDYKGRFVKDNIEVLPDIILVTDVYAHKIARECFPSSEIALVSNEYLIQESQLAKNIRKSKPRIKVENILIIGEECRDEELKSNFLEFESIDYLMSNLNKINLSKQIINVKLRLHPSESVDKYNSLQNKYAKLVSQFEISKFNNLHDDLAWADIVTGMNSYALVVSLFANIPTMSILPPNGSKCILPFEEILHLSNE